MITVCIPVYNYNITRLLDDCLKQCVRSGLPFEIILIDDGSNQFQSVNRAASENFRYIELTENTGRAKVRNLFLQFARYEYLLFLDCDSVIVREDFISTYLDAIQMAPEVVCGGRIYDNKLPRRKKMLRWKYGIRRESQPADARKKSPHQSFMTNNFMVRKDVFASVRFDERISTYGHEDTIFGYQLQKNNFSITHIDNPVLNGHLETNLEYLQKTKEASANLISALKLTGFDKKFINGVALLRYYKKIRKTERLFILLFTFCKPLISFLLTNGFINLRMFNFYKLGIFLENLRNESGSSVRQKLKE